jgi:CheY-like chemotaxis protein
VPVPLAGKIVGLALPLAAWAGCDHRAVSRSVLVVDDDARFRRLIARVLDGSGYAVIGEAGTVAEALLRAAELHPDTALVDLGLPDGDGFSLSRKLRALPQPVRVILISTDARGASRPSVRRAGACGFLAKSELSGAALRRLIEGG